MAKEKADTNHLYRAEVLMEGYKTMKQSAEKWDVTPKRSQVLCLERRGK